MSNWAWHDVQPKAGIGTPHDRWRLMHQSGRSETIASIRVWPHAGSQRTSSIAFKVRPRRSLWSTEMNHCSVARKITGFLHRQQCG